MPKTGYSYFFILIIEIVYNLIYNNSKERGSVAYKL